MTHTKRRSTWVELPAGSEATYYKVSCNRCPFTEVKLGGRNVALCQRGHQKRHAGQGADFFVVPMERQVLPPIRR